MKAERLGLRIEKSRQCLGQLRTPRIQNEKTHPLGDLVLRLVARFSVAIIPPETLNSTPETLHRMPKWGTYKLDLLGLLSPSVIEH